MSVECSAGNIPPGYKQTEVGVIPEDWDVKKLGEVVDIDADNLSAGTSVNYAFNYISLEDVDEGLLRSYSSQIFGSAPSRARRRLRYGDVLVSTVRPNLKSHLLFGQRQGEWICSTGFSVVRCKNSSAVPSYIFAHLFATTITKQIESLLTGSNYPAINGKDVKALLIPLPPTLAEQEAIAEALSDTNALIESLEQLISKKRQIKQGAMQELLTGKKRLPGFEIKRGQKQTEIGEVPIDWNTVTLENATLNGGLVRGPFGGALKKELFVESGYKVYEQRNAIYETIEAGNYFIDSNKYKELERFCVHPGDFIVSCSGTIGCIYQIPIGSPEGVINQALLKISLNRAIVDDAFFLSVFRSRSFQERIKENSHGGAMQNLVGMDVFRNTTFQLPSKAEQETIATILSYMDSEITALEEKLAKARQIKQGMMQELLTGKIRLI